MKKNRFFTAAMVLIICCTAAVFIGGRQEADMQQGTSAEEKAAEDKNAASSKPETVMVTDVLGREVIVTLPVKSVTFNHYGTAEALKILDAWDLVVARSSYLHDTNIYPNIDELPALGPTMANIYEPNMELLYDLDPDLLILEVIPGSGMQELIDALEGTIPVVALKTYDPVEMVASFKALGRLLGKEREATEYINWCLDIQNALLKKTGSLQDEEKTRMFYKSGWSGEGLGTLTNDISYIPTRNMVTGCINIAADLPSQGGWVPSVDPEWLVSQDFEVLVIGDSLPGSYGIMVEDTSALAAHRSGVMAYPTFADTSAVKNDRVYMQSDVFLGTPRSIIGFAYMAKWFHPDLFEDLNPRALHQEYCTRFLGIDVDLMIKGVFVYPEE